MIDQRVFLTIRENAIRALYARKGGFKPRPGDEAVDMPELPVPPTTDALAAFYGVGDETRQAEQVLRVNRKAVETR